MNTNTPTAQSTGVLPDWRHAFGGVWRLTARRFLSSGQWLFIAAMLALLAVLSFAAVRHASSRQFFSWTIEFYLTFLVPIMAFLSGAGSIRDDMKAGTVDYVLTRPLRRPAFVVFKYLCQLACIEAIYLLPFGVLLCVGLVRGTPGLFSELATLLLAQVLTVPAFMALGLFCGVLTSRYLVIGILYAGIVEVGIGKIPTQLNRISLLHHVEGMLQGVRADAGLNAVPGESVWTAAAVLLSVSAALLLIAALLFSLRELTGGRPKET